MENSVEFALPARKSVTRIPLSTLNQRLPPLTWEQLAEVENKLTSMFGPNLDDIFVTTNSGAMSTVSMTLSQPITSISLVGSTRLPSPRTVDPRRSGINLSVSDPTTPRSAQSDLRKKVLAALNKTSEELFLAMQAAECNLAAAGPASFPYRPPPAAAVTTKKSPTSVIARKGDLLLKPLTSPTGSSSKRNTPEPAHSGGIRRSVPKLSIDDRDMKNVVAKADNDQQPRLKNMEKFFYIAGTPGLVALVLAFFGDDDDLAPAETTDQGLFALLNTTNSMASSLLSNVSHSVNAKEKTDRHERTQMFLARRSSWLDLPIPPKPGGTLHSSTDSQELPSMTQSASVSFAAVPTNLLFTSDEHKPRRKITSAIFRQKKPSLQLAGGPALDMTREPAEFLLDVEPRYISDAHGTVVDKGSLLLPAFGFRLELGTPLTPEQRSESCKEENLVVQSKDNDMLFYKEFFIDRNEPHINFLGFDPEIGPIAVTSELREKDDSDRNLVLVRTKKGIARTSVPPTSSPAEVIKSLKSHTLVLANAKFSKVKDPALNTDLLDMERKMIAKNYKFGILYVKEGQTKENEMFANVETSAAFDEFLEFLGDRIVLRDWKGFRGGLDVNRDSTGTHSVHTRFKDFEIMFHVSTLLPFNPADEQQLERKRHLGNDIVVIIFVDGSTPFSPSLLKSEFNHTFVVVQPHASPQDDGKTFYKIGFADKVGVRSYAPLLPDPPVFEKNQAFRHWFMTKLVNAERASLHAPGFKGKIQRTRMLLLKDMIEKYCKKDIMPNADSFSMG